MGHAGAIISGNVGTAQGKIDALTKAGADIAETPWDIPSMVEKVI
jgi:succinyl-CoA synthetase alpha subunit